MYDEKPDFTVKLNYNYKIFHKIKITFTGRLADSKQISNLLFGGTKIIVAGDPLQLPPVNGEMINKSTIWKSIDTCIHLDFGVKKMHQTKTEK